MLADVLTAFVGRALISQFLRPFWTKVRQQKKMLRLKVLAGGCSLPTC